MTDQKNLPQPQIRLWQASDTSDPSEVTGQASFNVPTVLLLPGANAESVDQAQKQIKEVDWLLGTKGLPKEQFQLIGMHYNGYPEHTANEETYILNAHDRGNSVEAPQRYKDFVRKYLLPLADAADLAQTKKNFRNLNIVSYSYGSVVAQFLAQELEDGLRKKGFAQKDCKDILSQVLHVSFAATADVSKGPHFTSYHITNINDEEGRKRALMQYAALQSRTKDFKQGIAFASAGEGQYFLCANRHSMNIINNRRGGFTEEVEVKGKRQRRIIDDPVSYRKTTGHGLKDSIRYSIERNPGLVRYEKTGLTPEEQMREDAAPFVAHHGFMMVMAPRTLIANGISNSIENLLSDELVPLPPPEKLFLHRENALFPINSEEALGMYGAPGKMSESIDYNNRISALVGNPAPQSRFR